MIKITYSIIIPHRNSIELLKRAVLSIPRRGDVEILIIDNSSNKYDFSELISFNYHIHIYYSELSRGAGGARNIGLQHAHGKWILFLDADDFFMDKAFQTFDYFNQENNNHDIIFFKWSSLYSDTLELANRDYHYNKLIDSYLSNKTINTEANLRFLLDSPCGKMVSLELIKTYNVLFDECKACNDAFFSTKTGFYAKSITASNAIVYCATVQKGSITNVCSAENLESRLLANLRIYRFLHQNKVKVVRPIIKFIVQASHLGPRMLFKCISSLIKYSYNPIPEIIEYLKKDNLKKKKIRIEGRYIYHC